jgi:glyoxalase family protein
MDLHGLHHITLVASDARRTADFYTRVLGLYLVKKTVNFDDPGSYHLYFGNEAAQPGSLITFFEWPSAPKGLPGIGGTHHFALAVVDRDGLLRWKRRLTDLGLRVQGPYDRTYFTSIYFRDPDGQVIEIATEGPGFTVDEPLDALGTTRQTPPEDAVKGTRDAAAIDAETWPEPVPEITPSMALRRGMHHISAISSDVERTHAFFGDLLGLHRVKMTANYDDPGSAHWYWGSDDGRPGTLITYFEHDPEAARRARIGAGQTHHYALAVTDEEAQLAWRERLVEAGLPVSPVRDRVYFKSIYTRDPDGHIVELATLGPGFAVDEPPEALGSGLMLPPWLEPQRGAIERRLTPLDPAAV